MTIQNKLYSALVKAKAEFKPVIFDKVNPHFKAKFASLGAIEDATREALAKHGIAMFQPWEITQEGETIITTVLVHESGEMICSKCVLPRGAKTDQQYGASITYTRRYQAASLLGVVGEEDDDGESDQGRVNPPHEAKKHDSLPGMISEKQQKMMFAITKDFVEYRDIINKRYESFAKIPSGDFNKLLQHFEEWKSKKAPVAPKEEPVLDEDVPF